MFGSRLGLQSEQWQQQRNDHAEQFEDVDERIEHFSSPPFTHSSLIASAHVAQISGKPVTQRVVCERRTEPFGLDHIDSGAPVDLRAQTSF